MLFILVFLLTGNPLGYHKQERRTSDSRVNVTEAARATSNNSIDTKVLVHGNK